MNEENKQLEIEVRPSYISDSACEEKLLKAPNGMLALILGILIYPISIVGLIPFAIVGKPPVLSMVLVGVAIILMVIVAPLLFAGIKVLKPNEAYVLTLFGKYYGTLKGAGMFSVNPFVTAVNPAAEPSSQPAATTEQGRSKDTISSGRVSKKISMKAMTFGNEKQKINDLMGNPIVIGIVVIWKVTNTTKAVFNVDNYREFLSIQCDSALRNIVRLYPYDVATDGDEKSLRGSSQEIAKNLQAEIQARVDVAGLEICEARITHLAYAPEIAAVMLQRQQASAIVDARKMIVEGAVGMVEMALDQLSENHVVELDEERKAAMVSNLLVVLCGNKDAQPVVNSGSLY